MSTKKAGGSTTLGRDSNPQYLGLKLHNGQMAQPGNIIIRQRGSRYRAGKNVSRGKDDTLYAVNSGVVTFEKKRHTTFTGKQKKVTFVSVV